MTTSPSPGARPAVACPAPPGGHLWVRRTVLVAGALVLSLWLGAGAAVLSVLVPLFTAPEAPRAHSIPFDDFKAEVERQIEEEVLRTDD